jgi:hypothetical protein
MAQKKRKKAPPHEHPYVSDLELHDALAARLDQRELQALERQIRRAVEIATERAVKAAVEETYKRHWAITMRVLRDRFGWGRDRLRRLWDACLDYLKDMDGGLITPQEMLDTLEHEDGIRLTWRVVNDERDS